MKDILYSILEDLNNYKRDKESLLSTYVEERLDKSLQTYYKDLINSFNYLERRDTTTILKNINR